MAMTTVGCLETEATAGAASEPQQDMAQVNGSHKILVCHANALQQNANTCKRQSSVHETKDKSEPKIILMVKKC